jgi:hypothetical protein
MPKDVHPLVMETETKVIRAEACAMRAEQLKRKVSCLILFVPILAGVSPFS